MDVTLLLNGEKVLGLELRGWLPWRLPDASLISQRLRRACPIDIGTFMTASMLILDRYDLRLRVQVSQSRRSLASRGLLVTPVFGTLAT